MTPALKREDDHTLIVDYPEIPFWCEIPGGAVVGTKITIEGRPKHNCRRFSVNVVRGDRVDHFVDENDISFHYNPRFDHKCIVRNTRIQNKWGEEERPPKRMPFMKNVPFVLTLTIEQSCYRTDFNKSHFIEYQHRIPVNQSNILNIDADVIVNRVRFESPVVMSRQSRRSSAPRFIYSEKEGAYLTCVESVPFDYVSDPDLLTDN